MAHYQTASTCNVEFLKSSKGFGSRIIKLNYDENAIPPQLVGRMDNVSPAVGVSVAHSVTFRSLQDLCMIAS